MKSLYILASCILAILWMPVTHAESFSKEKKYSGHFSADRGKLTIDNCYGKLTVNTWDRNEVTVDITVSAKARSAEDVQSLLDRVSISEPGASGSGISYKTTVGRSTISNAEFKIDYVINMPRRHTAKFINKYGDIELAELEGKLEIDLEYGALRTAAIKGNDKDIKVGYGSATIASIETGRLRVSYSKLSIDQAGSLEISNQYEKTTINSIRELNIDQRYGDLKIGSVTQLKGEIQYAGLRVDKLLKSAQMTLKYSTGTQFDYIGPNVDNLNINASFSNLSFHFDNDASLAGDVTSSFGNISNSARNISLSSSGSSTPGHSSTSKVKIGSGRGNINLNLSYGNVSFR